MSTGSSVSPLLTQLAQELQALTQGGQAVADQFISSQPAKQAEANVVKAVTVAETSLPFILTLAGNVFHLFGDLFHKHAAVQSSNPPPSTS